MKDSSFYQTINLPYYIYAPEYTQKSAGIRMLHSLCHALNEFGAEAYIVGTPDRVTALRTPLLRRSDVIRHYHHRLIPIMVYPEVVSGNPLKMPFVVRWLLNKPGILSRDNRFAESDMLFTYDKAFFDESLGISHLSIPAADLSVFNNSENPLDLEREGACYYAHKYLAAGGQLTEHVLGATSLCQDKQLTPQEIAQILRRSSCLYCYEPTALITEALLCGCPVVMIPSPYLEKNLARPMETPGVAPTPEPEDIERAKQSVHLFAEQHQTHIQHSWEHIRDFHYKTQEQFLPLSRGESPLYGEWVEPLLALIQQSLGEEASSVGLAIISNAPEMKKWLRLNMLSESQVSTMAQRMMTQWTTQPSFHLLMVVNAHELEALSKTLNSLKNQLYRAWGLTIISDVPAPEAFIEMPENIEWVQLSSTLNEAIDQAVEGAGLDWLMQLLPGDELSPHALLSFAETINLGDDKHFIYSDELRGSSQDNIWFKPDFSLDYLRAYSYIGGSFIVSYEAFKKVGGYTGFAYVYATDLAFKVYENFGERAFAHIPDVLYTAAEIEQDQEKLTENEWLIRHSHFNRMGMKVTISHPKNKNRFQTQFKPTSHPLVSILLAHHNQANHLALCLDEIASKTDYPNYEIIVVDVNSDIEDLDDIYMEQERRLGERFRIIRVGQLSYSESINAGVEKAQGEYLVLLSCYARTINSNWLSEMLPLLQRDDVAVVGARIIHEKNQIVHAGGVLGCTDDVSGLYQGLDIADPCYMERAHCIQEYASVSSACLIVRKQHFHKVGGLSTDGLSDSKYLITDFCLKQKAGHGRILWTPYATVFQDIKKAFSNNGVTDYKPSNGAELIAKWPEAFKHDSFYNDNLSLRDRQSLPETRIICQWDRRIKDKPRILALPMNSSAVGEYRLRAPLRALEEAGHAQLAWLPDHEGQELPILPSLFELHRLQPDVLYVQQALSDKLYVFLDEVKAHTDISIIFSLDDLVTNLPALSERRKLVFRDMRYRLRRTLKLCDRVIVSTEPLAELCRQYCEDVVVIPNRLEEKRWLSLEKASRGPHAKPRVGWAGAWQHSGDLSIMTDVVKELADKVDWVFMGMCPPDIRPYVSEFHEFVSYESYPQKLADLDLDLALAPLEVHPFNEAKSNLRLLEYGILGYPVIASDVYPYRQFDPPVSLVPNHKEAWMANILAALDKPEIIAAHGRQLEDWVRQSFILEDHLDDWMDAFNV